MILDEYLAVLDICILVLRAYLPNNADCSISWSFLYQFAPNLRSLIRILRATLERIPISQKRFLNVEFCRRKTVVTRHLLVRAKGEVFVLLYVSLFVFFLFGQRFLSNPLADSRQTSHEGVAWVGTSLLSFWGLAVTEI